MVVMLVNSRKKKSNNIVSILPHTQTAQVALLHLTLSILSLICFLMRLDEADYLFPSFLLYG